MRSKNALRIAKGESGLSLIELTVAFTILLILTSLALPLTRISIQRQKELELRQALREIRTAIDKYKFASDNRVIEVKLDTEGYPPDLQTLVDGIPLLGTVDKKLRLLRRIPKDPMTNSFDWGLRSYQDDPESTSWGGQNVFDVFTKSQATALDGSRYSDW